MCDFASTPTAAWILLGVAIIAAVALGLHLAFRGAMSRLWDDFLSGWGL